jgi:hypothetical protein
MPGLDGTGPGGQGPLTGRGLGKCLAYGIPLVAGAIAAFGFGRGRRRGFANQQVPANSQELLQLKDQAQLLKENLNSIQERISELENQ